MPIDVRADEGGLAAVAADLSQILVPLDGSELAEGVLEHVLPLALRERSTIHLLRVTGGPDAQREGISRDVEEAAAREHLARVEARLTKAGARAQAHTAHGDPVAEILGAGRRLGAGLIAMCSHGRSGVLRWIRGSVAETVLREATMPLLLVSAHSRGGEAPGRFRRILVPLAGNERSASVLPYVVAVARGSDTEVVLLRVEWSGVQRPLLAIELAPEKVAATLLPWKQRVEAAGLRARVMAVQGDPTQEILDVADREHVDLVALATHGRIGLMRMLDGSVTEKVLRHCRRPLLVVRTPDAD